MPSLSSFLEISIAARSIFSMYNFLVSPAYIPQLKELKLCHCLGKVPRTLLLKKSARPLHQTADKVQPATSDCSEALKAQVVILTLETASEVGA